MIETRSVSSAGRPQKHSFTVAGHRTSISLERAFWDEFRAIAERQGLAVSQLLEQVDRSRGDIGLSSAVRVFVLHDVLARQADGQSA